MSTRSRIAKFIHGKYFSNFITALILLNAVTLGLETNQRIMASHDHLLHLIDHVILWIFVAEVSLRIAVFRGFFFKSGWNIFDLLIVTLSLIPAAGPLAIVRTLRILRVLRLISVVPKMRKVVTALFSAIPGMTSVMSVLLVIFYVAAVMTTQIFGKIDDAGMQAMYGTIGDSMFTLFQLMTMDGWSDEIAHPTMVFFPNSWWFFILFIIITSFAVLNLFIGIIVDALNIMHDEELAEDMEKDHSEEMSAIKELKDEIAMLRLELQKK